MAVTVSRPVAVPTTPRTHAPAVLLLPAIPLLLLLGRRSTRSSDQAPVGWVALMLATAAGAYLVARRRKRSQRAHEETHDLLSDLEAQAAVRAGEVALANGDYVGENELRHMLHHRHAS